MPTFSSASSVNSTKPTNRGESIDILSISDAAIDSINIIKTSKRLIFASNIKTLTRLYHQKAGYTIFANYTENPHRKQKGFVIIDFSGFII